MDIQLSFVSFENGHESWNAGRLTGRRGQRLDSPLESPEAFSGGSADTAALAQWNTDLQNCKMRNLYDVTADTGNQQTIPLITDTWVKKQQVTMKTK